MSAQVSILFTVFLKISYFKKWNSWFEMRILSMHPYKKLLVHLFMKNNTEDLSSNILDCKHLSLTLERTILKTWK